VWWPNGTSRISVPMDPATWPLSCVYASEACDLPIPPPPCATHGHAFLANEPVTASLTNANDSALAPGKCFKSMVGLGLCRSREARRLWTMRSTNCVTAPIGSRHQRGRDEPTRQGDFVNPTRSHR